MTSSLRHRRRAERFAQLLEEASGGRRQRRRDPLDDELAELVALRHRLVSPTWQPELDPEFRTGLRAMLMATAEREGIGATAQPEPASQQGMAAGSSRRRSTWQLRAPRARTAVVAGVAVGAVAFTGMSAASENAMPGDALYGVKRSTERAQLALASSDVGRGALYLGFAQTRLAEARLLGDDLDQVLDDMDKDASEGVRLLTTAATSQQDPVPLDTIDEFATEQRAALEALAGQVDGTDATRVATSLQLLDRIVARTDALRDDLDQCGGSPASSLDALGPLPRDCVALPPPSMLDLAPELTEQPAERSAALPAVPDLDSPGADPATPAPGGQPDHDPLAPVLGTGSADEPDATVDEDPAADEDVPADDDSLFTGLNRILGNLLGG
jgi:uncharacterized protein DUF5667